MTNEAILKFLRGQGWMPALAGPGPEGHIAATEQTAAGLPQFATGPQQFEPQTVGPDLPLEMRALSTPSQQVPTPTPKPWQPPAQKAGAVLQQAELIKLSRGETVIRFADPSSNFQRHGLLVKQRSDAVSKVSDAVNAVGVAVNAVLDNARAAAEKRQRESGAWPEDFEHEGAGRRCPGCRKLFWDTQRAWRHLQKGCPERVRIAQAMAEYQPCTYGW